MFKRSAALPFPLVPVLMLAVMAIGATPAWAEPALEPVPAAVEFGNVDLHFGGTQQQNVKFTNNSSEPVLVIADGIAGADAARFQIVGDSCNASFVGAGENCSVEIAFAPSVRGSFTAKLLLDTGIGVVEAPLSASAVTGTPSASPNPLSFSPIPYTPAQGFEGEYNETEQINVQNSSDASTLIESATIAGPGASSYSIQWNGCEGDLLATNNSCNLGVRFAPSSPGATSASLILNEDSASGPLVVALSGLALHGPQMTLDTAQALLGNVRLGSSVQQTFTVGNSGDYPLAIQRAFLVSGTPLMFPVRSDSCSGHILYPAESCAINVAFEPTALGEKSASLLFITNTPAINVAGIDGIGVASSSEVAPSLAMPLPSSHGSSAPAASPATPIATPAATTGGPAPTPPPALTALRPPRLYSLLGHATLDPGADVQCPAGTQSCEALGVLLPGDAPHISAAGLGHSPALLGTGLRQLRGGEGAHVHIPLSRQAAKRLHRLGRMRVRVVVVVQSGGLVIAQQSWTVKLSAAGLATRVP
ncbi:MAG TPA: choice-of-anchor D domain-containing protein [Solirubrobacteraceae bacterium]|jgi:hypothetical protein|nr:choice-of-anchor D domain-containing protein [Solirubrobacteraceae bacterium]